MTSVAAVILTWATVRRAPDLLRGVRPPWAMALGFSVVTLAVAWARDAGALAWLATVLGTGDAALDLLRVAGVTGVLGNVGNNLPAYLAVEGVVADDARRLFAALIGANAGPLVTPWASLATLLWLERCRADGVRWRLPRLGLAGLACAALAVAAATCVLAWS